MIARWNNVVLAESADTITIEGNHYFPPKSLKMEYFQSSDLHTVCAWKGEASYYSIVVGEQTNENTAWYYPAPKDGSIQRVGKDYTNYVAFWHGVEVTAYA